MANERTPMDDLMASIGWFLLHWSSLEAAINNQIAALREQTKTDDSKAGTRHAVLGKRLKQLQALHRKTSGNKHLLNELLEACAATLRLADARNAIVHRLTGADARTENPFITCDGPQGPRDIDINQLRKLTQEAEDLRRRFAAFPTDL
jgi:hypothetical protein